MGLFDRFAKRYSQRSYTFPDGRKMYLKHYTITTNDGSLSRKKFDTSLEALNYYRLATELTVGEGIPGFLNYYFVPRGLGRFFYGPDLIGKARHRLGSYHLCLKLADAMQDYDLEYAFAHCGLDINDWLKQDFEPIVPGDTSTKEILDT